MALYGLIQDSIQVFNQNYLPVFTSAQYMSATVKEEARTMEHPIETGATVTDHRVILPTEIELIIQVSSFSLQDMYRQINQLFTDGALLIVQTRTSTYTNQFIQGMPHDETPDQFNVAKITLKLKQAQIVSSKSVTQNATVSSPKVASNANKVTSGTKQPTTPTPTQESTLASIFGGA